MEEEDEEEGGGVILTIMPGCGVTQTMKGLEGKAVFLRTAGLGSVLMQRC